MYWLGVSTPGGLNRISLITTCPEALLPMSSSRPRQTASRLRPPLLFNQNSMDYRNIGKIDSRWIVPNDSTTAAKGEPLSGVETSSSACRTLCQKSTKFTTRFTTKFDLSYSSNVNSKALD